MGVKGVYLQMAVKNQLEAIIKVMAKEKLIVIDGAKITYTLKK